MFSDSFKDNPEVMLLLVLIFSLMGLLFYYLRKKGKKRYQFDERYEKITNRFKAKAWDIMWVVWLVSWMVVIMFDGIHFSFFLITALVVTRSIIMLVCAMVYAEEDEG